MFTKIQLYNAKAQVNGAAINKLILDRLPHIIIEQIHTVHITGKSDEDIINIVSCTGRTVET